MRFLIRNEIPIRKKLLGTCAIGIDLLVLRIHAAKIFRFFYILHCLFFSRFCKQWLSFKITSLFK